jgi:hypothetical protein
MRGQAFIIFKDINSAMEAKRKLQSKELFGKKLVFIFLMERITFAKEKSDSIAKIEGTFNMREKPKDYFQKKFEEKFVLRPKIQSEKRKLENDKKQGKRFDQVLKNLCSTTFFLIIYCSHKVSPQQSLRRCSPLSLLSSLASCKTIFHVEMCDWLPRTTLSSSSLTSLKQEMP